MRHPAVRAATGSSRSLQDHVVDPDALLQGQHSRVQPAALLPFSVAQIVKRYAAVVGLDAALFAGTASGPGFITSAAESGAALSPISRGTRASTCCAATSGARICSRITPGRPFL